MASTSTDGQSARIFEMMERLGIEPDGAVVPRLSLRYATAFRGCHSCPSTRICREWLEQTPTRTTQFASKLSRNF